MGIPKLFLLLGVGVVVLAIIAVSFTQPQNDFGNFSDTDIFPFLPPLPLIHFGATLHNFLQKLADATIPPHARLMGVVSSGVDASALSAFDMLGIADAFDVDKTTGLTQPTSVATLSKRAKTNTERLSRLLDMLAARNLLVSKLKTSPGMYDLLPTGNMLRKNLQSPSWAGVPSFFIPMVSELGPHLAETLKHDSSSASQFAWGKGVFDYYNSKPELAASFTNAMRVLHTASYHTIPRDHDFSQCSRLVDAGGGLGTLAITILKGYPQIEEAIVFDIESVALEAKQRASLQKVDKRVTFLGGSLLNAGTLPPTLKDSTKIDCWILHDILHDYEDEEVQSILTNVKDVLREQDTVSIVDVTIDEQSPFLEMATGHDITMLLIGGKDRSIDGYSDIASNSGLALSAVEPLRLAGRTLLQFKPSTH